MDVLIDNEIICMYYMLYRAYQTRRSGQLLRLGFNEVAQFLSKSEVLVALVSLFKSVFFSHTGFDVQYFIPNSLIASF